MPEGRAPEPVQDIAKNDKNVESQPGQSKPTAVKKRKPQKRGLMEACAHGLKIGTSTAVLAAKVAYGQGRTKQASEQERSPTALSVSSQHNALTKPQTTALENPQQGGTQPSFDTKSPDANRNQSSTQSPPIHVAPVNKSSAASHLENGSIVGAMLLRKPLSHDPQNPHSGETVPNDKESTKRHSESVSPYVPLKSTVGGLTTCS
jgi:hypothetical protein